MNFKILFAIPAILLAAKFFDQPFQSNSEGSAIINSDSLASEVHLKNIQQLTFGGENAECYFSFDGTKFSYQTTHGDYQCDQIFKMNVDGSSQSLVSTGKGRTTCSYYFPDNKTILFASTHLSDDACPPKPDFSSGYVWALYDSYDIFTSNEDGTDLRQLTSDKGYDAEATISPVGDKIIFTSTRDGDIDLYKMNLDGTGIERLTNEPGYDGGAFFSKDGSKIVYRRTHFDNESEIDEYKNLLSKNLVKPGKMEIWVMDSDGSNKFQVTSNGAANFAPYFFPDGNKILFCSNIGDPKGRNFDIYSINVDGTGLEQITTHPEFDGFPMFSPDGSKLVFCSNRNGKVRGETNVFICDWE